MNEFQFQGVTYRHKPLDGDVQIGILRRLLPAATAFAGNLGNVKALFDALVRWREGAASGEDPAGDLFSFVEKGAVILQPVSERLAALSDDDVGFIVNACLGVTLRVWPDGTAKAVRTPQGAFTHKDDGKLPVRLMIAWNVVRADLGGTLMAFAGNLMSRSGETPE